jgi:hypothetical protein
MDMEILLREFSNACRAKFERGDMRLAAEFVEDFDSLVPSELSEEEVQKLRRGFFQILK